MAIHLASGRVKSLSLASTHCATVINSALWRHNLMVQPTDTQQHLTEKTDDITLLSWLWK